MKQFCYFILLILFTSCTSDADFNIPANRGKLVLNSLITPDEPIVVDISASIPITETIYPKIKDAIVLLYENDVFIDTLTYADDRKYKTDYIPKAGATYTLVVNAPGYNQISATDIVPKLTMKAENLTSVSYEYPTIYKDHNVMGTLDFDLTDDSATELNYYEIQVFDTFSWGGEVYRATPGYWVSNEVVSLPEDGPHIGSLLFTNKVFQGKTVHFSIFVAREKCPYIKIRKISPAYYEYKNAWYLHDYYKTWRTEDDDVLFKGEPIKMFTNVEGAYGIFASYSEFVYEP
ncbi:hypothetical protein FACS1894160_2430 [Bacteroidia bacterium]|nr:hypothetical protein FACS1894160_2430 [Bacteroidia bacterium]